MQAKSDCYDKPSVLTDAKFLEFSRSNKINVDFPGRSYTRTQSLFANCSHTPTVSILAYNIFTLIARERSTVVVSRRLWTTAKWICTCAFGIKLETCVIRLSLTQKSEQRIILPIFVCGVYLMHFLLKSYSFCTVVPFRVAVSPRWVLFLTKSSES